MSFNGFRTIAVVAAVLATTSVHAQNCRTLVNDFISWIGSGTPAAPHRVQYVMSSNQSNDVVNQENVVAWSAGELRTVGCASPIGGAPCTDASALVGSGRQLFTDRVFADTRLSVRGIARFDPRRADQLGVTIWPSGLVIFTLRSWGNTELRFTAQCHDRALTGTIPGVGNRGTALVTLTLAKYDQPLPTY